MGGRKLTILIARSKESLQSYEDGHIASVCWVRGSIDGGPYTTLTELGCGDVQDVEIGLIRWWGGVTPLFLPDNVKKAVITYLHRYHSTQDMSFDCYSFACLVAGIPSHDRDNMDEFWRLRLLPRIRLVGDTFFLMSELGYAALFQHAAIYLGYRLYLSVWGAGGHIEIATLRDMKRTFCAERAVLATPCIQAAV